MPIGAKARSQCHLRAPKFFCSGGPATMSRASPNPQALISFCLALYAVMLTSQSYFQRNQWSRAHLVVHHQGLALVYLLMAICAMGGVGGTFFAPLPPRPSSL